MLLLRSAPRRPLLSQLIAVGAAALALAMPAAHAQVKASLVAADSAIQAGRPFTVALRLVHAPHWHTYWINPGTGLPTTLEWELPEGFSASEIRWPAPHKVTDRKGNITGNGYEDDLLLPVTLTPPADLAAGTSIELKAVADWLMCESLCIPGSANLSLSLPVTRETPAAHSEWGPKIGAVLAELPRSDPAWKLAAARDAKTVTLVVTPAEAGGHTPRELHFFSDDNLVSYDRPQTVKPDGRGGFVLTLPISMEPPDNPTQLIGVLTSSNGWRSDGSLRGLRVEIPWSDARSLAQLSGGATGSSSEGGLIGSFPGTLFLAFVGGLILNLMPCVFPVLGIKILGFVNQAGSERSKVVAHGLVFTAGVLLSFWALAGLLAVLRAGGDQLGWGFQLQSPAFVFVLATVMLVFALNLSGVFEFGLRATGVGANLQMKSGYGGSFFTGVLATVVATPCSAPFLAPALGAALALSTAESFVVFTAIALGLAMPYLLLSIFPGAIKALPRPGAWMETFKQFMAFPLYATVAFLVWVLAGQTSESGSLMAFFGLVLIAMAAWFYGRWHAPGASAGRARFGVVAGAALLALGAWIGWPKTPAATDVVWEPWSPAAVAKLREEGRIVYVDFTARWCATCQTNKQIVFSSEDVLSTFRDEGVATLKADWTNQDATITAELAKYGRSAVPFNLIWLPGQQEPVILPELLTPGIVLEALRPALHAAAR